LTICDAKPTFRARQQRNRKERALATEQRSARLLLVISVHAAPVAVERGWRCRGITIARIRRYRHLELRDGKRNERLRNCATIRIEDPTDKTYQELIGEIGSLCAP
jgi:hypothetical protein